MIRIIPAIDIKGGKVVRLTQGKAEKQTVYYDSPIEVAKMWVGYGIDLLHVVDLDGAIEGRFDNMPLIKEMVKCVDAKIELGGGLRDEAVIKDAFDAGVEKAVVGTRAIDTEFLSAIVKKFDGKIVVSIDARDGIVYTKGWLSNTGIKAVDLAKKMADMGVKTINYTDIARDGMLEGPNIKSLKEMLDTGSAEIVAAGGISTLEDVKRLKALEGEGLKGMIIGKALYEKTIDLKEAVKICSQNV
ncbi:MAG: 1-(5-phosphoribosyl)-5-[(5-phosphoribosylamino)methylideneamino]imidazole-4-carboxamide isomerase [Candidatus Omnitrophota bacterium]|jgi:phosphoribosylformimino-5-aminoimidazole carboxamide ribotide isomerase